VRGRWSRGTWKQLPPELRERAVRMVAEVRPDYPSDWPAIVAVASRLGIGSAETLPKWCRQAEVDAGTRPGVSSEEPAELRKLRAEVRELRRANEILKAASAFFALARPPTGTLVTFISGHRARFGVEPICRVLTEHGCPIAPSTYYDAVRRGPSLRALRDAQLKAHIARVHAENYGAYGVCKGCGCS
jgi:transposase